jgi:hypothetical protein
LHASNPGKQIQARASTSIREPSGISGRRAWSRYLGGVPAWRR